MSLEIHILAENITAESNDSTFSFSEKKPAAGYHLTRENTHTAIYNITEFAGAIKLQGTLAIDPSDQDWFNINNTEFGGNVDTLKIGDSSILGTGVINTSFIGNFVWIRAAYNVQQGSISQIAFSF
jgi:hypothetical protein